MRFWARVQSETSKHLLNVLTWNRRQAERIEDKTKWIWWFCDFSTRLEPLAGQKFYLFSEIPQIGNKFYDIKFKCLKNYGLSWNVVQTFMLSRGWLLKTFLLSCICSSNTTSKAHGSPISLSCTFSVSLFSSEVLISKCYETEMHIISAKHQHASNYYCLWVC